MVGYLIAGLPAGPVVDRTNPWRVLVAADAVRLAIFLILFGSLSWLPCGVWTILGLAWAAGVAGVFFETALVVAVRDLFQGPKLLRANSFLEGSAQLSAVLGPALVGLVATGAGLGAALLLDAATFAISLATLRATARGADSNAPEPADDKAPPSDGHGFGIRATLKLARIEFVEGLRFLRRSPFLTGMVLLQVVTTFAQSAETLIPYFARDRLGEPAHIVGSVVAGGGLGGILAAALAGVLGAHRRPLVACAAGVLAMAVGLIGIGLASNAAVLIIANMVFIGGSVLAVIIIRTIRQQIVPRPLLGRVTSSVRSVVLAAGTAGTVLAGVCTHLEGNNPRPVFLVAAALIALALPLVWISANASSLRPGRARPAAGAAPVGTPE
ncbi:MFS transporter [Nocardia sp. NPDC059091]|uniref:MFS transporter n=1 Tax=unclassified Nocardia TaxID=2637762 RepID=UPI0036BFB3E2